MSKFAVAIAVSILLVLVVFSQIANASDSESDITLAKSPQITINVSNNISINVSYFGMILTTNNTVIGVNFEQQTWNFQNTSSGYSYESSFLMGSLKDTDLGDFFSKYIVSNEKQDQVSSSNYTVGVNAYVNFSKYTGTISSLLVKNSTLNTACSINQIPSSTIKTSLSIDFTLPVALSEYNIYLIQVLRGSEDSTGLVYENVSATSNNATYSGIAMQNLNANNSTKALYWWSNNFLHNGLAGTDKASIFQGEENEYLVYNFTAAGKQGKNVILQDPFLSVNGISIIGSKITHVIQGAVNYFLQHIIFTLSGFVIGAAVLLSFFVRHLKGRIKI